MIHFVVEAGLSAQSLQAPAFGAVCDKCLHTVFHVGHGRGMEPWFGCGVVRKSHHITITLQKLQLDTFIQFTSITVKQQGMRRISRLKLGT